MTKRLCLLIYIFLLISYYPTHAQIISGALSSQIGEEIRLHGFDGFNTYLISSTATNEQGEFDLIYSMSDYGVGYLVSEGDQAFFIILSGEDIELVGESLSLTDSIELTRGRENRWFGKYASEHPRREAALSAWVYLRTIYQSDSLFAIQQTPASAIDEEITRIQDEDSDFLNSLPPDSYVHWFLPTRKLVSSVSTIAQYRTEEIPGAIQAFREMDYTDQRLHKSGLLQDVLDSQIWLIENSGRSLDSAYVEMNRSINYMLESLKTDEQKFNDIVNYLFNLLERRSLFTASEHLALRVLNDYDITLDQNLAKKLETYRAMQVGNTAPDIEFGDHIIAPGLAPEEIPASLSELDSDYALILFGAGWCPRCREEIPDIAGMYPKLKEQGIEVVFISLDDSDTAFREFAGDFPFLSVSDFKRWDSPIVSSYHVFATPTMVLLNRDRNILVRPNSARHLEAWVDWYLVQGNPTR